MTNDYVITLKGIAMVTLYEASKEAPGAWFSPRTLADRHARFMGQDPDAYWQAEGGEWRDVLMAIVADEDMAHERWGQFQFGGSE